MTDLSTIDTHGSLTEPGTLTMQRILPGPVERVWAWLTDSDMRARWLAAGEMPLEAGARFTLTWRNDTLTDPPGARPDGMSEVHTAACTVIEAVPPARLKFVWEGVGTVGFELRPAGERVLLTLTHSGLTGRGLTLGVSAGWHAHLDIMQARLEGTNPKPHWDNWRALRDDYTARNPE